MNCLYNGPAKNQTDPDFVKMLDSVCPELSGQPTCCSPKQLQALSSNLQTMKQLASRCPACWNNMRRLYCQMTCNRDQSVYMDATSDSVIGKIIQSVNFYVAPSFKQGLFDSCKDVTFPGNNEKVLNLLCGTSVEKCTPQKLLRYMGSTSNGFAPFNIYYPQKLAPNLHWMNETIFKCNEPFTDPLTNRTAKPCSCQDCASSCPVHPPPPPEPTRRKILGLDVLSFSLLVSYFVSMAIFIPTSIFCSLRKRNSIRASGADGSQSNLRYSGPYPPVSSSLSESVESPPGVCERLGNKLESFLCRWFTKWGTWCGFHPFLVMGVCIAVVGGLACGLLFFTVTTDPVQLWSAPSNEAREERDIYNSKFSPFYRTEQLIIRPVKNVPAGYKRYGDQKWIPFGPIFHLDLLNQVIFFVSPEHCCVQKYALCLAVFRNKEILYFYLDSHNQAVQVIQNLR